MCVNVTNDRIEARVVDAPAYSSSLVELARLPLISGNDVVSEFKELLANAGLTPEEADGLIFSWRKDFFETAGSRFILLMSERDYDALCPIQIRPAPTEMVRVGIVLTEFK